jgi:hypothetical protein
MKTLLCSIVLLLNALQVYCQLVAPTLISPANGTTFYSSDEPATLTFLPNTTDFQATYNVLLFDASGDCNTLVTIWNNWVGQKPGGTPVSVSIPQSQWNYLSGTYYWQVRCYGLDVSIPSEECRSFEVVCSAQYGVLGAISPCGGETKNFDDVTLQWNGTYNSGALYHIQLSEDYEFNTKKIDYDNISYTQKTYICYGLQTNHTYYWRVRAEFCNHTLFSDWSNVCSFNTNTTPSTINISNLNDSYDCGESLTVYWTSNNVNSVDVSFSSNGGSDWITICSGVNSSGGSGSCTFDLPEPTNDLCNCYVKVKDNNSTLEDVSNQFTVRKCGSGNTILTVTPNPVEFGMVEINQTSEKSFTLKNESSNSAQITINSITDPGNNAFKILNKPITPFTLNVNGIQGINVEFKPTDGISYTSSIVITYSANGEQSQKTVTINGSGGDNPPPPDDSLYIYRVNNTPFLKFNVGTGNNWEGIEDNVISNQGNEVIINDYLKFEGSMEIDTTPGNVSIKATGLFKITNVRIGRDSFPDFILLEDLDEEEIKLDRGIMKFTAFENDDSDNKEMYARKYVCGIKVQPTVFEFGAGLTAAYIKIGGRIWIQNTKNCGDRRKRLELSGEFTFYTDSKVNINGTISGFEIAPNLCLRHLVAGYDSVVDTASFRGEFWTPFLGNRTNSQNDVKIYVKIMNNKLQNFEFWADLPKIPIGQTGVAINMLKGSIEGIYEPPIILTLGGRFINVASDDLFQLELTGQYKAPSLLSLDGRCKFLRVPGTQFWAIPECNMNIKLDWNSYMTMDGSVRIGNAGGSKSVINGDAHFSYYWNPYTDISGSIFCETCIPDLNNDQFPFDWINSIFGLPKCVQNLSVILKSKKVYGNIDLGFPIGAINFTVDLSKQIYENNYFTIGTGYQNISKKIIGNNIEVKASNAIHNDDGIAIDELISSTRENGLLSEYSKEFSVDDSKAIYIIRITSPSQPPQSYLRTPSETIYTETQPDSSVIYSVRGNTSFWTIPYPIELGTWAVKLINPGTNDSLKIYKINSSAPSFELHAINNHNTIQASWNSDRTVDSVEFYYDTDNMGFNGKLLSVIDNNLEKTVYINIDSAITQCNFYLYAIAYYSNNVIASKYADNQLINYNVKMPSPELVEYSYNKTNDTITIRWKNIDTTTTQGYIIILTDQYDNKDTIGNVNPYIDTYVFSALNLTISEPVFIEILPYDENGIIGCGVMWHTGIDDLKEINQLFDNQSLLIYPNPAKDIINIKLEQAMIGSFRIQIINCIGKVVFDKSYESLSETMLQIETDNYPPGLYNCILIFNDRYINGKFIIIRDF